MGRILIGNIKGPQGEAGKNFEYAKTYASVSAMNADFSGTDVDEGEYVVISAGIDDADNGRVYRKGTSSYVYVNRVNGPTGPRGATGPMPTLVNNLNTTTAGQGALDAAQGPTIAGKVTGNGGEAGDTIATFTTSDTTTDSEIIEYTAMEKLTSGSPLKTLMSIMSKAVKNVRWFQKLLGTTDISGIGNGTVTNAVSTLNDALGTTNTNLSNTVMNRDAVKVVMGYETSSFGTPEGTCSTYMSGAATQKPTGAVSYGNMFQMRSPYSVHPSSSGAVYSQIFVDTAANMYVRAFNNGSWTAWKKVTTTNV